MDIPGFLGRQDVEDLIRGMNDVLVNDEDVETRSVWHDCSRKTVLTVIDK